MSEIARTAGVAKGTVFLYFSTKEAVFLYLAGSIFRGFFEILNTDILRIVDRPEKERAARLVESIINALDEDPLFLRALCILHTTLEQNIEYETAAFFKNRLREECESTGRNLEACLPFLKPGEGAELLIRLYAVLIGFQNLAEPSDIIKKVIEKDNIDIFRFDLRKNIEEFFPIILRGMEKRTE